MPPISAVPRDGCILFVGGRLYGGYGVRNTRWSDEQSAVLPLPRSHLTARKIIALR